MAAILYLLLCFGAGSTLLRLFPSLTRKQARSLSGARVSPFLPFITLPAAFIMGYILLGWIAYAAAYSRAGSGRAMVFGCYFALAAGAVFSLPALICALRGLKNREPRPRHRKFTRLPELLLVLFVCAAAYMITFVCFYEDGDVIHIGVSVFSDFSPHIAMIRSFSRGENFPTQYAHFADGTIRYHFLFEFAAGVLEYLGLPLTWAFNLPSFFCFVSLCLLVYSLAHILTGRKVAALLSVFFLWFRSGGAIVTFLLQKPAGTGLFRYIWENTDFIGTTQNENWGLFNQNVYANQRHLSLGMSLVLLSILICLPLFERGIRLLRNEGFLHFCFGKEAWLPDGRLLFCLPLGMLLGAAAFWHGSMVISALLILCLLGAFSAARLSYLFIAVPAVLFSSLQSRFFTGGGNPLSLKWDPGFLAADNTPSDILGYILLLTGIFFVLYFAGHIWLWCSRPAAALPGTVFFLAVMLPLLQAFTVTLTAETAVSHKQVMLSLILGGILPAWLLVSLWGRGRTDRRSLGGRILCLALVFCMTCTGMVDLVTYWNKCTRIGMITIDKNDALVDWIDENTEPGSVFITSYISIHPVFTAGRFTLQGWPYFAWSAGYDTTARDEQLTKLLTVDNENFVEEATELGADYIYVDQDLIEDERFKDFFMMDGEALLAEWCGEPVYSSDSVRIYQIPHD